MNKTEVVLHELETECGEIKQRLFALEFKLLDLKWHTVSREKFDALLDYLKQDWKRVEAHIEFTPRIDTRQMKDK